MGMKNRLCLLIIIIPLCISSAMPQNKLLTLQDVIPGGKNHWTFIPRSLRQMLWCDDLFLYAKGDSLLGSIPLQKEAVVSTLQQLNEALNAAGQETVRSLPYFSVPYNNKTVLAFRSRSHLFHYDYVKKNIVLDIKLNNKNWQNFDFSPSNDYLAFTEGNNLRIISPKNEITKVTNEIADGIVCGQAVHQREFGINKGTFWSPKGTALAFYRMDESMVTDYPFVNIDQRCAKPEPHKYPMAGMKSHEVTVGIFYLATGKTVWLKTGLPKEKYLTNIAWSPDEQNIYIAELNRDQNIMDLVQYSAISGEKLKKLFTETDEHYVEPLHPMKFLPNDNTRFVWQSERDGYNHLYLFDINGKLLKQLTKGCWVDTDMLGFDSKGENIYITSTQPHPSTGSTIGNPMNNSVWKVNIKSGKSTCMSIESEGIHKAMLSPSGKYLLDNYSAPKIPRIISLLSTKDGKRIKTLLKANDPYMDYAMPEIVVGTIKAADNVTDLHYRLVKPVGLDENKKYPTIIYVYGGPHAQLISNGWMNDTGGWDIYMAQRGYVMFSLDSRGSANRGHAFESVIHRNLGVNEMADQIKGVEFLKSLSYVDTARIGVHGWSYGGFMTTNLMCSYPDVFKVAVAGGPVIDWSNYEIMYGERYMDRPQDNPEGYKNANLKLKAGNLRGHLLIIQGDIDPIVVWQHSLGFLKACVDANTYPDYFVYPRHEHNVIGKDRPHLYEKITRYFDDYLK